jgi:putative flavoprotein involved in K+ transport
MTSMHDTEHIETVVIGGGQAGLAAGYHLQRQGLSFVILDANDRTGDAWRKRWDSLHLFTPAKLSHLPGVPRPGPGWSFPSKDEFADYLEDYAARFDFDVRHRCRVQGIERVGDRYLVMAGEQCFEADHVVLATGAYQEPRLPAFAPELHPEILQLHSSAYRSPRQLQPGTVLVVGSGNSGAEIAIELAAEREVTLAGSKVPVFPVRPTSAVAHVVMPAFLFAAMHILTTKTPMGRRLRPQAQHHAAPLVRVKPRDIASAGVRQVGRIGGVQDGRPCLEDGTVLDVRNVIWCTGFRSDFSWIDLPSFASGEEPAHERGVITDEPGMYLVGHRFQYALASSFIAGVGRDAEHIAGVIAKRVRAREREAEPVGAVDAV